MTRISPIAKVQESVLILVDIQEKLLATMPMASQLDIVRNSKTLLQAASALSIPVMVTEQYPKGLGATKVELAEFFPAKTAIYEKTAFSAFQVDGVVNELDQHQRKQIIVMGLEAHICVLQTAVDLFEAGYQVFVVEDAVCSRAQRNHLNAINRLSQTGVVVSNTESVLFEWLADAKHPDFRVLSKLII